MAEAALFSVTSMLIKKLGSPLLQEFGSFIGVKKDLKKLQSTFTAIQAVLKDAEEQQWTNNAVRDWLDKLKDVAYDIEDILDEIETEDLPGKVNIRNRTLSKVRNFFTPSNLAVYKFRMTTEVREVMERLDEIAKERFNFNLSKRHVDRRNETTTRIQTHSYAHVSEVYGREADKEKLVQLLIDMGNEQKENVSVIPILGMGGLGKTTLAKLVYNDDRVKSCFDNRMWAFVSENFDQAEIIRAIIASAHGEIRNLQYMDPLQSLLRKTLDGKKYLLVLDDVWNENQEEWLHLKALLKVGARGSKVMVTTRSKTVASIMSTCVTHELAELQENDCWSLFKQRAFPQGDEQAYPNLLDIGKDIVHRCKGVPLAIKSLGGMLHSKRRESYWRSVRDDEIWKLNEDQILSTLRLSYNHLPSHLKQCFTFFGVFPKGHRFKMNEIIQMWIAEGFIQPCEDGKLMEDIGEEYFDDLCWRSLLQEEVHTLIYHYYEKRIRYKLHDLIHDLARSIGQTESLIVEARKIEGVSERARHSSIICTTVTKSIDPMSFHNARKLRTFVPCGFKIYIVDVPNSISSLTQLRVLDLGNTSIKSLPDSISKLKHLRYLDLSHTDIETLPKSICSLRKLQTLKVFGCDRLRDLPNDMWKMISLRHFEISENSKLTQTPPRIGELSDLQTWSLFIVSQENGRGIDELQGLNLRGELNIKNLQDVLNPLYAEKVKLREKENLRSLSLSWEEKYVHDPNTAENQNYERVIESLQPHSNIQELSIKNYMGTKFPSWLMNLEVPNLIEISLINCRRCEILPPLWKLRHLEFLDVQNIPHLEELPIEETEQVMSPIKKLSIKGCPKLTRLPHLPSLEGLTLIDCNEKLLVSLEAYPGITFLEIGGFQEMKSLPEGLLKNKTHLSKLIVRCCHKLKSLSKDFRDLSTIRYFTLDNCGEVESLMMEIHNLTSLEIFIIRRCASMESLPDEVFQGLKFLRDLHITDCKNLRSLGQALQHLSALTRLKVCGCPRLAALPESLDKLTALGVIFIIDLPNLASLPQEIGKLTSLRKLEIQNCPKLLSLPESLQRVTGLKNLTIDKCSTILERRCTRDKGKDWHKIAHVPLIFINGRYI